MGGLLFYSVDLSRLSPAGDAHRRDHPCRGADRAGAAPCHQAPADVDTDEKSVAEPDYSDVDATLSFAQTLFVNGEYEKAIAVAKRVDGRGQPSVRSARIRAPQPVSCAMCSWPTRRIVGSTRRDGSTWSMSASATAFRSTVVTSASSKPRPVATAELGDSRQALPQSLTGAAPARPSGLLRSARLALFAPLSTHWMTLDHGPCQVCKARYIPSVRFPSTRRRRRGRVTKSWP